MSRPELKRTLLLALEQNDLDLVVSIARQDRKALSQLIRISYDKDTLAGWRAIKAIGRAARELVKTDEDFLRTLIRKLLWSLSDESGGIGWSAPEILGEIVSAAPDRFNDFIPLIAEVYEVEEKVFRPGVVYALARIGEVAPERVVMYQKIIIMGITDQDPLVKVNTLDLIDKLWNVVNKEQKWSKEYLDKIVSSIIYLKNDAAVVWIYSDSGFIDVQVGESANLLVEELGI